MDGSDRHMSASMGASKSRMPDQKEMQIAKRKSCNDKLLKLAHKF